MVKQHAVVYIVSPLITKKKIFILKVQKKVVSIGFFIRIFLFLFLAYNFI